MVADRLTFARLASPAPARDVSTSSLPDQLGTGIVHLGIGAFHRAHQAVYTEEAMARAGGQWGIVGVSQRSPRVRDQLRSQDCRYGVLTRGREETSLRLISAVRDAAFAGEETERIVELIAAPTTHIVSLTVTEKAYYRAADGGLDLSAQPVRADLAALERQLAGPCDTPALTPLGLLTRGLARRAAGGGEPITIISCDNMVHNGAVLARLVREAFAALPSGLGDKVLDYLARAVAFPATMVDRIVPATTEADRARAEAMLGLRDEALVVAEPFTQWVIQNAFAGPRPAWEQAGASLTDDVEPFELAKLRLLNGSHSLLAYRGALRGHRLVADAIGDPGIEADVRRFMTEDAMKTLTPPDGLDLARYCEDLIERFRNPNTGHTTIQIAMDGSQKVPIRHLGVAADRLRAGHLPDATARAVAAWLVFIAWGRDIHGHELPLDDPLADTLRERAAGPLSSLADRMMRIGEVFAPAIAESEEFVAAIQRHVDELAAELGAR